MRTREEVADVLAKRADLTGCRMTTSFSCWPSSEPGAAGSSVRCVFGYAQEAAAALVQVAFGRLGLHRVFGRTDARNDASAALMRRLGMRQEAHFRHHEVFKGEWGDELIFAVLEEEWSAE